MTISAVVDAAKDTPCCSRTLTDTTTQPPKENTEADDLALAQQQQQQYHHQQQQHEASAQSMDTTDAIIIKSNGHKSISTTENTHDTDASEGISRVSSSNSVHNSNRKSSINLEPGFIETIMDDYTRKTN